MSVMNTRMQLGASCSRMQLPLRPRMVSRRAAPQIVAAAGSAIEQTPRPRNEEARKYFRSVYDFTAWQKHRSQFRYFSRLALISQSHVLQNIVPSVLWVMTVAASVGAYATAYKEGVIPEQFPNISTNTACTAFIAQTSVALSLLLVFRTNSSYGRWDEVRKMWGGMLNRSRDLALQTVTYFPEKDTAGKKAMERWIIAFANVLRIHLQNEGTVQGLLGNIMTPKEIEMLEKSTHRPMTALNMLTRIIREAPVGPAERLAMLNNITFFQDVLGGCERILRAPIPVSYTRHTARFLFVWLTTLPFALWPTCGWAAVPLAGAIAAVLGGIEEIGVQCEEPFGILPLDVIAGRIATDVVYSINDTKCEELIREALGPATTPSTSNGLGNLIASGASGPLSVKVGVEGGTMKVVIADPNELVSSNGVSNN